MQQQLQELIKKYEGEVKLLLSRKNELEVTDPLYAICELSVLQKQNTIADLRGIL